MGVVLATSRSFSSGSVDLVARLAGAGHSVRTGPADHDLDALRPLLADADAWIAGTGPVTAAHLDAAPRLRVVARYGVGYEAVDVPAATERGITVTNTPGANSAAVADHAVGLMLAVLRGIPEGDRRVRAGEWRVLRGRELGSLRVGLVGFGRIGRGVAARLSGFAARIAVHDPWVGDDVLEAIGAVRLDLAALPAECDLVTLHSPGGGTVVDARWLAGARPGLVLVNTARPDLVDEAAVADALRSGALAGFAADTLAGDTRGDASPLLAPDLAERVVVTPHFGAQTVEAVDGMGGMAVDNVLAVLAGDEPPFPVPGSRPSERTA
ncbi:NAD(P)-dependent oxidoreductase [Planctomonas deserti]|uniref:NAD(P)-dependent oxidoreductase n=1 Tax=Planctomonas deserti TaxID=2144185 RepID=UPI000D38E59B|nr:NAD(P)-dependent oxidoreductase [Planctomonas deserti]